MQLIETPQLPRTPRRDGWTAARRARFLEHLAAGLDVKRACALVGLSRPKAYALRGRDAAFAAAWEEARRAARAAADETFLALLPDTLRSVMAELPRARDIRPEDFSPRTVSGLSGPCHLIRAASGARHGMGGGR